MILTFGMFMKLTKIKSTDNRRQMCVKLSIHNCLPCTGGVGGSNKHLIFCSENGHDSTLSTVSGANIFPFHVYG